MAKQSRENADMLERCVTAIENLSPKFEFLVLPTGGKVSRLLFSTIPLPFRVCVKAPSY